MDSLNVNHNFQVEIMSKRIIKPSSPTPNHLQNYKLSFFDQEAEKAHMHIAYFYPNIMNSTPRVSEQQLEESLSRMLSHVYPTAGRFAQDMCSIICEDQGVTFIKAKVNCRMDDFLQQARNDFDLALDFWPEDTKDAHAINLVTTPVMVVQTTTFECGGLALSMSTAHPAMDGWTTFTFIYEWSKVCKQGIPTNDIHIMSFNLANHFGPRERSKIYEPSPTLLANTFGPNDKIVAKRFVMDEARLFNLRDELTSCNNSRALSFKPSRVEMTTSILWRALLRASHAITGELKPSTMSFFINLRDKQLDYADAFGNFIIEVPITYERPRDTNMTLQDFIIAIRQTVQKTVDYCKSAPADDIVNMVGQLYDKSYGGGGKWGANDDVVEFSCSSLCTFHVQEADFGWGNPSLVHLGSRHSQGFWLYSSPQCGNSIIVQMDLKKPYIDFIEHHQDFLTFTKTFINGFPYSRL